MVHYFIPNELDHFGVEIFQPFVFFVGFFRRIWRFDSLKIFDKLKTKSSSTAQIALSRVLLERSLISTNRWNEFAVYWSWPSAKRTFDASRFFRCRKWVWRFSSPIFLLILNFLKNKLLIMIHLWKNEKGFDAKTEMKYPDFVSSPHFIIRMGRRRSSRDELWSPSY